MSKQFHDKLNLALDNNMKRRYIAIRYIPIDAKGFSDNKYIYTLYFIDLFNHHILHHVKLTSRPNSDDLITESKTILKHEPNVRFIAVKGSPFTDKKWTNFLEENHITYDIYLKDDAPEIVTISSAYLKRMLELHIQFNDRIHMIHVNNLIEFWNNKVVPVTHNLATVNLIENSPYLESRKSALFKLFKKEDESMIDQNRKNYLYILFTIKVYDHKRYPLTFLVLLNFLNKELIHLEFYRGYPQENRILRFLNKITFDFNADCLLFIPNLETFNTENMNEYYNRRNLYVQPLKIDSDTMKNYGPVLVTKQIGENFFKDYMTKILLNKDNRTEMLNNLVQHWNLHVSYILSEQSNLASKIYKDDKNHSVFL